MISVTKKGNSEFLEFLDAIKKDQFKNDILSLYKLLKETVDIYSDTKSQLSYINASFENYVMYYDKKEKCIAACPILKIQYKESPKMLISLGRILNLKKMSMLIEKLANHVNIFEEFYEEFKKVLISKIISKQKSYMDLMLNYKDVDVEILNASEKIMIASEKIPSDKILNTGFLYSPEDVIKLNFLNLNFNAPSYITYVLNYFILDQRISYLNQYFVKLLTNYFVINDKFKKVDHHIINVLNSNIETIVTYYYQSQELKKLFNILGGDVTAAKIIMKYVPLKNIKKELPILLSMFNISKKNKFDILLEYMSERHLANDRFFVINELFENNIYAEFLKEYKIDVQMSYIVNLNSNILMDFVNIMDKAKSIYIVVDSMDFFGTSYYDNDKNIQYLQNNLDNKKMKFVYYHNNLKAQEVAKFDFVKQYIHSDMPVNSFSKIKKLYKNIINNSISGITYDKIKNGYEAKFLNLY